jgi:hypothetical protein
MSDILNKIKKDLVKKKSNIVKSVIEIRENLKTGTITATHKFFKKDGALFSELTSTQQSCEILLWALNNQEQWNQIQVNFVAAMRAKQNTPE